ncbi:MAG: DUF448 domain-containing protein [Deltaproteobacteria bacterium]|nr:DUF448 domain-containing protein [Deltaproteobacteria bacterium]
MTRTCLGCRKGFPQGQLVRFVLAPDGELLVDYRKKLPGRGAYTCPSQECIREAVARKQFQRSFRVAPREIDLDRLLADLKDQILKRVLSLLGMARKSSQVVLGSNLVVAGLTGGERFQRLFLATDMSLDIAAKVRYKAEGCGIPWHSFFDKETMGRISGKSECSVIAVTNRPLADAMGLEISRLQHISGES